MEDSGMGFFWKTEVELGKIRFWKLRPQSAAPVSRFPPQMHYRNHLQHIGFDTEHDTEREGSCQAASNITLESREEFRIELDSIDRVPYTYKKPSTKPGLQRLIPGSRFGHLRFSIWTK